MIELQSMSWSWLILEALEDFLTCCAQAPIVDPFDEVFGSRGSSPDRSQQQRGATPSKVWNFLLFLSQITLVCMRCAQDDFQDYKSLEMLRVYFRVL